MDFNPNHERWKCCCFRVNTGIKLLGAAEIICGLFATAIGVYRLITNGKIDIAFNISLILVAMFMTVSSLLMVIGAEKLRVKLMYPTLVARVTALIFVTVFGVSKVVLPGAHNDDQRKRSRWQPSGIRARPVHEQPEPSALALLVFLAIGMLVVCFLVFYSIILVVRCIGYLKGMSRLEERRNSLIIAGQIDPELLARRTSKESYASAR